MMATTKKSPVKKETAKQTESKRSTAQKVTRTPRTTQVQTMVDDYNEIEPDPVIVTEPVPPKTSQAKNIAIGIMAAIIVFLVIMIVTRPKIKDNTARLKELEGMVAGWKMAAQLAEQKAVDAENRAAGYLEKVGQNKTYYITNKKEYEKIPERVRNLGRDSLRNIANLFADTTTNR